MRQEHIFNKFEDKMTNELIPEHLDSWEYAEAIEIFHTQFKEFKGNYDFSGQKHLFYIPAIAGSVEEGVSYYMEFKLKRLLISENELEITFECKSLHSTRVILHFSLQDEEVILFCMQIDNVETGLDMEDLYISTNDLDEFNKEAGEKWVNFYSSVYPTEKKPEFYLEPKMLAKLFILLTKELNKN